MAANPHVIVTIKECFREKWNENVKHTFEIDGNFPATCTYLYTTELVYLWVLDVCLKDAPSVILMR